MNPSGSTLSDGKRPGFHPVLFIRGIMPRSGTNFLADALCCHPTIARCPGAFWEFVPFRFQSVLDQYLGSVARSKHAHEFQPSEFLPEIGAAWLRYLTREVPDGHIPLYKEPSIDRLDTMFDMYRESRAVLIQRDGRDIVSSMLHADFTLPPFHWSIPSHWRRLIPGEAFRIHCRNYRQAAEELVRFLDHPSTERFRDRLLVVKYEDLLQDPQASLRQVMAFAGLDQDEFDWQKFSEMPVRGSSFLRDADGNHNFAGGVAKPDSGFSPTGRWQSWSTAQTHYYQRQIGPLAQSLGYDI